jgi:plastocyanin
MKEDRSFPAPIWGLVILAALGSLFLNPVWGRAAERCEIITIKGKSGVIPGVMETTKGSCIVWVNWTRNDLVSVVFKEGKECLKSVKAPVGFELDEAKGCFIAQELNYGETVSLVFDNPGTYDYEVQFRSGGGAKGSIVVKE